MNSLVGHCLILVGAGVAVIAVSFAIERREGADLPGAAQVVIAPRRVAPPAEPPTALPADRDGLIRALQRELKRVGCYAGAVDGAWGDEPRKAMRLFLADINASLPVEQPDDILLRLVRDQERRVCHAACPEEWATAEACTTDGRPAKARPQPEPIIAAAPAAAHVEPPAPAMPVEAAGARIASEEAGHDHAPAAARATADGPADGTPTQPEHPHARKAKPRPPKIVRLLIRNVQRSLAPLGLR
jgi:hypothetical protein